MLARIERVGDILYLRSGEDATQSAVDTQRPHRLVMRNLQYAAGCLMFVPPPSSILILGVGGGSLVHFFRHYLPTAVITGVERDEALLARMQTEFLLPDESDTINYVIADARQWLADNTQAYDLIVVDLYDEYQMPEWVGGAEFWQQVFNSLSLRGCVTANLLFDSDEDFTRFYPMVRSQFDKRTLCTTVEGYDNILLYGFREPLAANDMGALMQRASRFTDDYELPGQEILATVFDINPVDSGFI